MEDDIVNKLIPLKHRLKQSNKFDTISKKIIAKLHEIPDVQDLKIHPELINLVCNLIEYYCKKKYSIDKLSLLIFVMKAIIPNLGDDDINNIKDIVTYLHSNKLIITISSLDYVKQYAKNFFLQEKKTP